MRPGMFIVDDDADIREILRLLLEDAGYQVSEARDGASALGMLREIAEPHVVLLDQCLPGLTGGSLLQMVARDAALRSRHAYVLLTADTCTQARKVVQSVPHMDVAVVTKPFDVENLLDTITALTVRLTGMPGRSQVSNSSHSHSCERISATYPATPIGPSGSTTPASGQRGAPTR